MTIDELRERIKNQIVLHDGELADWQWPATGLPAEATELGITDFRRLVNDVSRQLNSYFGRILDLKASIMAQARKQQKKLSNSDIDDIVKEAERLTLSRGFVADQWIPAILKSIPEPTGDKSTPSLSVPPYTTYLTPTPSPTPATSTTNDPLPDALVTDSTDINQKVKDILDDYDRHIPVQALRTLFRAIGGNETALAEAVRQYLSANFFSAEAEPKGATLKEKLLSTDWRHLSWWESKAPATPPIASTPVQAEPAKITQPASGHPMVDKNYNPPLAPTPPNQPLPPAPQRTNLSGLWGVLFAVVFLLIVYLLVKGGKTQPTENSDRIRTEQQKEPAEGTKTKKKRRKGAETSTASDKASDGQEAKTPKTAQAKPEYEELRDEVGDYGEQPALKKGKWGLWRKEKWFIKPIYDEITVFQDGRATVRLGDISFEIDRYGNRLSKQ